MNQFGDEDLNTILHGSIPKQNDLCCLMGTINLSENNTSNISNKAYQCQIFKCRCLIFSVPEVIASPVLGAVQNIYIIISQEYYTSGSLKPHLDKMNIRVQDPMPLTNAIYEACLRYTVLARLAPSWNQVERYLVHSRDFLLASAPLDSVKLDVVINEIDMHVVLWPLRLRLPQVCAQDFQLSSFNTPFAWDLSSNDLTVHVLPSLNRANVIMVSDHIPQNSLFKSYKELKRHWKNSYGYRLPESEEGMLYLTVKFGHWFSESLTYPMVCVRARRPVFLRQLEPQKVLLDLLADLHAKVPYICGFPFGVDSTIRYAVPKLSALTQVIFPCNLSKTKPEMKKKLLDKGDEELIIENKSQPVSQYTQTQTSKISSQTDFKTRSTSPPPFFPRQSQLLPPSSKPLFVPIFTAKARPKCEDSSVNSSSSPAQWPPIPSQPGPHATPTPFQPKNIRPMFGGTLVKPMFGLAQSAPNQNVVQTNNKPIKSSFKQQKITSFPAFGSCTSSQSFNSVKGEKTLLNLPQAGFKKNRNKPQVQQDVDVRALAQQKDGLAKVNTTTLIAFLRGEGVSCKVKDRKGELVSKVLTYLKLPTPSTLQVSQETKD